MEELKCTKCGEEATTYKSLISGKCKWCGGDLEEEGWTEGTESEYGIDGYDY